LPSPNRSKVVYIQSAKNDLAAQTQVKDPRARYARFRSDATVRVFGDSDESWTRDRHQINDSFVDDDFPLLDEEGIQGARQTRQTNRAVQGVTVREHRARQRSMARRKSKAPRRVLFAVALLVALGVAAFAVYQSPAFSVRTINVEGAQRLNGTRLTELAAVPESSTLLRLDIKGIQSRVEADPWIESVKIQRSFPSTIVLTVVERQMAIVVDVSSSKSGEPDLSWLVSRDGFWLGSFETSAVSRDATGEGFFEAGNANAESTGADGAQGASSDANAGSQGTEAGQLAERLQEALVPQSGPSLLEGVRINTEEIAQLPHIKEVSRGISPVIGKPVTDEGVLNALDVVSGFSSEMLALVQFISAPDRVRTTIMLTNNVGVAFGAAEDVEAKEKVIRALLAEHEGTITYINVRIADRATYRATQ
jgi:cell division protein FtsQ